MQTFDQTRPRFGANRANEKRKMLSAAPKPKRWSHQDDLDALKGKKLIIGVLDEGPKEGVLLEADQFTLKLKAVGAVSAVVYYKSALTYFYEAI